MSWCSTALPLRIFSIFAEARVPVLGQAMGVAIQMFSLTALFVSKCTAQLHMAPVGSTIIAGAMVFGMFLTKAQAAVAAQRPTMEW